MRILLVNTYHFPGGGDSTYTFNLAGLLRAHGNEVAFFAMQDPRNIPDDNQDLFVSNIDFKKLNQRKNPVSGIQVLRRLLFSGEARSRFSRLLDRVQPDLLHLQNFMPHISSSIIMEAKRRRLPIVWTLHDYGLVCPNSHFWVDAKNHICEACLGGAFYQPLLKRCKKGSLLASATLAAVTRIQSALRIPDQVDAFLSPSAFLKAKLIQGGFSADKVHHLPLFLPQSQFVDGNSSDGYILFLGKLSTIKGILPLLDACRRAPDTRVRMAGRMDDILPDRLHALRPSNAEYLGLKNGHELRDLLRRASAVIVPSLWYENQPFSILEAFACAKPVIASDLGGMRELVTHRDRGLLVPPGDAAAIAEAMRWILVHPSEAAQMGHSAQIYAGRYHCEDEHYRQLSEIYRQVSMNSVRSNRSRLQPLHRGERE